MSNEKPAVEQTDVQKVIAEVKAGNNAQAEAILKLAEAILESRKPYKDPAVEAQKAKDRAELRALMEKDQRKKEWLKKNCPHRRPYDNTLNISWHEHSNGIIMGVCGECLSQFDARKPEDLALLRADPKAVRRMARAGVHARNPQG
jgi:hypothetical protein